MSMKKPKSRFMDMALNYFNKDYNCAQSVVLAMREFYGVKRNPLIPKMATAFGGGIGRSGSLCGAVTGGVMAIGLKYGTDRTELIDKETAYAVAVEFYERFVKEFGSPFCRELTGCDLRDPKGLEKLRASNVREQKCSSYVKKAVEILVGLG